MCGSGVVSDHPPGLRTCGAKCSGKVTVIRKWVIARETGAPGPADTPTPPSGARVQLAPTQSHDASGTLALTAERDLVRIACGVIN